jgi:hypothetical protein
VAGADLLLGLVRERPVDQVKQSVVLPEADAERDSDHRQRGDQPGPQLVQMTDR